ncbi:MAG: hypothetical protein LBF58_10000 [Deltaproteobacteria bacterium]|jgi:hypothetical protein|nr:hypothetical protein [Deltaproteobacteria bacterium]
MLRIFHYYLARHGRNEKRATRAVGRLKRQRDFFLIAKFARHESTKAAATDKLHDPYLLFALAKGESVSHGVRLKAANKLTEPATQEAYRDLALSADGKDLGKTYRNLALAVHGKAAQAREKTGEGEKAPGGLGPAGNGILPTMVWDGVITGREFLEGMGDPLGAAANETYVNLARGHSVIVLEALDNIPDGDEAGLKRVAIETAFDTVQDRAIERISDPDVLTEIVVSLRFPSRDCIPMAMAKIHGQARFLRIFKTARLYAAKLLAAERMDDLSGIMDDLVAWEKRERNRVDRLRLAKIIGDADLVEEAIVDLAIREGHVLGGQETARLVAGVCDQARLFRVFREARLREVTMAAANKLESGTLEGCIHGKDEILATKAADALAEKDPGCLQRAFKDIVGSGYVRRYVCSKLGHSFGENCVCLNCGYQEHTFDERVSAETERRWAGEGRSFTCRRCGAVKTWFVAKETRDCDYCSGNGSVERYSSMSGEGGGWEEICPYCKGKGEETKESVVWRIELKGETA